MIWKAEQKQCRARLQDGEAKPQAGRVNEGGQCFSSCSKGRLEKEKAWAAAERDGNTKCSTTLHQNAGINIKAILEQMRLQYAC